MAGKTKKKQQDIADAEYARLVGLYRAAGVDDIKLKINDSWTYVNTLDKKS